MDYLGGKMRKPFLRGILSLMLWGGLVLLGQQVSAAITSLPMSNPFCSQPDPTVNQCLINVRFWQANDNGVGNVLAYVNFSIDGKLRYRSNAFFENFVTYSFDMIPGGIKVVCGLPNEGGFGPLYGNAYTVDVKAYDVTDTWVLDDQLRVKCPAYNP
jgi:hypothetical protein